MRSDHRANLRLHLPEVVVYRTHELALTRIIATGLVLTGCSGTQNVVGGAEPSRNAVAEVTASADAGALNLRVGDCLDIDAEAAVSPEHEVVESIPAIPCDEPHDGEIYTEHMMDDGAYPGEEAAGMIADELCQADFEASVGIAYENSTLDFTPLFPSAESWEAIDDREVLCVVLDPTGDVTGSLRNANR